MRKFLVSAAIIGLVAAVPPALAQDREHQDKGGPPHGEQHGGPQGGGPPQPHGGPGPRPAAQANPEPRGGPDHAFSRQNGGAQSVRPANEPSNADRGNFQARPNEPSNANRGNFQTRPNDRSNADRGNFQARPNEPSNANRGDFRARPNEPSSAMRGPGGSRRDFGSVRNFHQNFRAERRFHAAAYARPRGYFEHRWTWGETLPPFFWTRQYWILDYFDYDLPPPPYGAVWVRVNDDAVLIDQYSGMIIEVDYGVFY
jgi:Ni/Co efflux regulator RcnB